MKGFEPEQYLERKEVRHTARFIHLAVAAARMAVDQAQLPLDEARALRTGVVIGSGIGGFEIIEREHTTLMQRGPSRVSPFFIPSAIVNLAAGPCLDPVRRERPDLGPGHGLHHRRARHWRSLRADRPRRGRCDDLRRRRSGDHAARASRASRRCAGSRPATTSRRAPAGPGIAIATASSSAKARRVLVLERLDLAQARGAAILAEIRRLRHVVGCVPRHASARGRRRRRARDASGARRCRARAGDGLDYLNAHATSTLAGDRAEALAIGASSARTPRGWR